MIVVAHNAALRAAHIQHRGHTFDRLGAVTNHIAQAVDLIRTLGTNIIKHRGKRSDIRVGCPR